MILLEFIQIRIKIKTIPSNNLFIDFDSVSFILFWLVEYISKKEKEKKQGHKYIHE